MKRFLLITHAWPPMGGAGAQRPLKLAKYIGGYGWQPVVVTPARHSAPAWDRSLSRDLPRNLILRATPCFEPAHHDGTAGPTGAYGRLTGFLRGLLFPDRHLLWLPTALPAALAATGRYQARAVLATGPPFSSFILAWVVSRLKRLPLLLDFRDEWSGFYAQGFEPGQASGRRQALVRMLEGYLVRRAAAVCGASPAYLQRFARLYQGPDQKYHWIPNGYDPQDFADHSLTLSRAERLRVIYIGTIFGVTTLDYFWAGLARLSQTEREGLEVILAGRTLAGQTRDPQLKGLHVRHLGYLEHNAALKLMSSAHVLLLTLGSQPGSDRVIPAKLFEYLAACRPVLALVPPGITAELVREHRAGAVVPPGRPELVARQIRSWLNQPPGPLGPPPEQYDRRRLAGQMAALLDKISAGGA